MTDTFDAVLSEIHSAMADDFFTGEPSTHKECAEDQIARRVNALVSELDEMMAMAANPETVDLIENEILAFGQMRTRVNLILSFLAARNAPKLKMVSNHA
jgi:hypothetical protein